ncbi:UPF0481 protein At3g47200-like isoform X2 [Rutidosis leptorrhynchoides]
MENYTDMENGDVDIVEQVVKILLDCEVNGVNGGSKTCIFKVPSVLRAISPDSYNPRVVSIGPLHREAENVQAMEARKATYRRCLLNHLNLPLEQTLRTCVKKITASIDQIKESYFEMNTYTNVELAQMMVMDGFFILEFLRSHEESGGDHVLLSTDIVYDLLLLENQIPFFVLQDLFDSTILIHKPDASLKNLILHVLRHIRLFVETLREVNDLRETKPDHILGLMHKCYQPAETSNPPLKGKQIHSACELDRAYVKFMPNQDPSWAMEIKFEQSRLRCFSWSCGNTLRMPVIQIYDFTESLLRNLIVYEQSAKVVPLYITSYTVFIDTLVDTKEDIVMLMDAGVIINNLAGSTEELANIFNNINKQIDVAYFFYNKEWAKIDEYYNGWWTRNVAWLRRRYFSNPWSSIAFIVGTILFTLAFVQTIYTVKGVKS